MHTFQLNLVAANKPVFRGDCESIIVLNPDGYYGVQAHHRDMVMAVSAGIIKYRTPDQEEHVVVVSSGLMKVEDNTVLVLVDTAELPEEIDINRAQRAADHAKEALLQKRTMQEYKAARAKLRRELSRLSGSQYREL